VNRRRRRKHGQVNHERWLVSYADFITLLFAFFVVLYAASQVDKHKASALAAAIEQAFQSMGVFPGQARSASGEGPKGDPADIPGLLQASVQLNRDAEFDDAPRSMLASKTLSELKKKLETVLEPEIRHHELAVSTGRDGLVISLREFGFFESGSASLRVDAVPAFAKLATVLAEDQFQLRVEGHTDDVPIHNTRYDSNWELSTARATETIRVLLTEFKLDPARVSAAGYAEFHPTATNRTFQGRSLNRRVDIVVLAGASHLGTAEPSSIDSPLASE
jgi:chemotaxis protein MotB